MPIPADLQRLTELFHHLGAREPGTWANSQIQEGMPQLHRFLFLREAWRLVVQDQDTGWMDDERRDAAASPAAPFAGIGHSLERLLAAGAQPDDLADLVRGMQAKLLFNLCYLLDNPWLVEPEVEDVGWCLVTADDNAEQRPKAIQGLHESVLEMDPTGREMWPGGQD